MKNIKKKIENIIKNIKEEFFSESEFQIYLATELAKEYYPPKKGDYVKIEENNKGKRIDIVISKNNEKCFIEIKYKLKNYHIQRGVIECFRNNSTNKKYFDGDRKKLKELPVIGKKLFVFITNDKNHARNKILNLPEMFYEVEEID